MTATLLPEGKQSFQNSAGAPLIGGKVYTYDAGTNTPRTTYQDAAGTIPNTNPIVLDARGEAVVFWSGAYKVVLKDASDVTIWSVDNVTDTSYLSNALTAALAAPPGSSLSGFIQSGAGAVARTVQDELRETVKITQFGATTFDLTGAVNTAALNAAIAALPNGGEIKFPSGVFLFNAQIPLGKNIRYVGAARASLVTKGTVLQYTGALDFLVDLNGINNPVASNIVFENINFYYQTQTVSQKKGLVWLQGSTFVKFVNCTFSNGEFEVICDQAELVEFENCDFETFGTGGIWLTNGADKSPGASQLFTNRINVSSNCQFNSATGTAIIDDGGVSHVFESSNFNACVNHIRVAGVLGLYIGKNEFEVPSGTCINFASTTFAGTALTISKSYGAFVGDGNFFLMTAPNIAPVVIANTSAVATIEIGVNDFSTVNTSLVFGEANAGKIFYSGLSTQRGAGTAAPLYNTPYQFFNSSNGNSGQFALSAASAITINNNKVTANSVVLFTPVNAAAAQAEGSAAKLYAAALAAGVSFQPSTGNGSNVSGVYNYFIFN